MRAAKVSTTFVHAVTRWVESHNPFFLPVKVLGRVFRGTIVAALRQPFRNVQPRFRGNLTSLARPLI